MITTKKNTDDKKVADIFPGAAIDVADDEKVTAAEVKQRTKRENNNPRDNDLF